MNPLPITDTDVSAYVDGQLPAARLSSFEAALAHDAALAARVAQLRQHNAMLHDAFDPWLAEPLPERLIAAASAPEGPAATPSTAAAASKAAPRVARWMLPTAAAAATLVVGIGIGWFGRDALLQREGTPTTFARQAALTHALYASDVNRPVEIWAAEEKRLVNWLSKRLGFAVRAPDLNALGFALVGGRLVAGNEMPAALFVYENADKQRMTLLVRKQTHEGGETAFRYAVEDGVGVYYWIEDRLSYALSGNLDRAQLLAIGRVVYGQLAALEAAPAR